MILSDYNQPLVTILLTTFNAENFLVEQIESILHQTYSNIELVIHDDASDDRTCSIIEDYCQKYSNIKLIKNNHNIGCVNNFESAISSCSAKYIALSDQDDIWVRNKLEMQMQNLLRYEKGHKSMPIMVHSDLMMIDESNRVLYRSYFQFRKYKLKKHKDLGHILGPCGVMGNTILFNDALKKLIIPFPHNLSIHDYWIALITELLGKRITIYSPLVQYRIHSNNLSNNQSSLQRSKGLVSSLKAWKNQKKKIPYAYPERVSTINYILRHYDINENDQYILRQFKKHLLQVGTKTSLLFNIFQYSFVKRGILQRMKIIIKAFMP